MGEYEALTYAVADGVAQITLSRPELLNRGDDVLHVELTRAMEELRGDGDARAAVLASTGKVFSAGGDFELMRAAHDDVATRQRIVDDGQRLFEALIAVPQPLVVALHGAAIGLGATIVLTADAIVAARGVQLSDPHVLMGLVAGDGGCVVWPQAVGMLRARRHLLTGDPVDAETAHAWGLVTDLVDEPDDVLPEARRLAARLAALPPLAVQGTKRALNRVTRQRTGEVLELSLANEETTLASADLLEAIAAFGERRPGAFRGR